MLSIWKGDLYPRAKVYIDSGSWLDIVRPEQFPDPAAFLTCSFVSAIRGMVQATMLFSLLWIGFPGWVVYSTLF